MFLVLAVAADVWIQLGTRPAILSRRQSSRGLALPLGWMDGGGSADPITLPGELLLGRRKSDREEVLL